MVIMAFNTILMYLINLTTIEYYSRQKLKKSPGNVMNCPDNNSFFNPTHPRVGSFRAQNFQKFRKFHELPR